MTTFRYQSYYRYPEYYSNMGCDHFLYTFAWWSVTGQLIVFGLLILGLILVLMYGAASGK